MSGDPSKAELATICLGCDTKLPRWTEVHHEDIIVCGCGVGWRFSRDTNSWRYAGTKVQK